MLIKPSSKRTLQLAFGSAIGMLILMGAVTYRSVIASGESSQWIDHTHQVMERLQDMVFGMEAISSSMRRFVITGDESDLDRYRAVKVDIDRLTPELRRLTADNPYQQARIPILEKLAAGRAARAELLVNLRREQGIDAVGPQGAVASGHVRIYYGRARTARGRSAAARGPRGATG
jgi:methyl-accepting chemotaxis protein